MPSFRTSKRVNALLTTTFARGRNPDATAGMTFGAPTAIPSPTNKGTGPFVRSSRIAMDHLRFAVQTLNKEKEREPIQKSLTHHSDVPKLNKSIIVVVNAK